MNPDQHDVTKTRSEILKERYQSLEELDKETRMAVETVIDLAKASFTDRPLTDFPEIINRCLDAGERVRGLALSRMNQFLFGKPLNLPEAEAQKFEQGLQELSKVIPMHVVCPSCHEAGSLAVKAEDGEGGNVAFEVVHRGDGTEQIHSAGKLSMPDTIGLELERGEKSQRVPMPWQESPPKVAKGRRNRP